jgi:hypothetical protein
MKVLKIAQRRQQSQLKIKHSVITGPVAIMLAEISDYVSWKLIDLNGTVQHKLSFESGADF